MGSSGGLGEPISNASEDLFRFCRTNQGPNQGPHIGLKKRSNQGGIKKAKCMSDGPTIQSTPTLGNAFAGDVTAQAAWDELGQNPDAILIDVRSDGEWTQLGIPDLSSLSKTTVLIELETQTGPNPNFATQVTDAVPAKDDVVIFICRSGARSAVAATAMAAQGFTQCYNLLGGADVEGWNAAALPWRAK